MSDLEEFGRRAIDDPIRTPPPVASLVSTATQRRQRRRVAVGMVGALALVGGIGAAISLGGGDQGSSQIDVAGPVESAETGVSSTSTTIDTRPATGDPPPDPGPVVSAASTLDTEGLIAELQLRGVEVTEVTGDASSSPFLTGSARSLCVNGRLVRLFEYESVDDRRAESDQITTDGQPNDLTLVSWTGFPRFFAAGNLIALHLSGDSETLALLSDILGPTLSPDGVGLRGSGDPPCDADFLNDPQVEASPPNPEQPAPTLTDQTVEDAKALITGFIDALGRGDTAGARQMWTGYPFGDTQASREFDRFLDDFAWLATTDDPQLLVVPSFAFVEAAPVVTVAKSGEPDVRAPSFVLSIPQDVGPVMIERLPTIDLPPSPLPVSAVEPGEILAFDVFPIEGIARAFLNEQEIGVAVDWELRTINVLLPDKLPQTFTLTVTFATPEIAGAFAVTYSSSSDG